MSIRVNKTKSSCVVCNESIMKYKEYKQGKNKPYWYTKLYCLNCGIRYENLPKEKESSKKE